MEQKQSIENGEQDNGNDQDSRPSRPCTMICIAFWTYVFIVAGLWVIIHDNITDDTKSFEVFIASAFSLALVIIVVIHAVMYLKQAKAMIAQIEATDRNTVYAQRAYVVAKIRDVSLGSESLQFLLSIDNAGNSPANDVTVLHHHGLREAPPATREPHSDALTDYIGWRSERFGLIGPSGSHNVVVATPIIALDSIPDEEYQQFLEGVLDYYCWGRIHLRGHIQRKAAHGFLLCCLDAAPKRLSLRVWQ